jgi:hypothetical protein
MPELRAALKQIWRILPTVIVVSVVVCAIAWMIDARRDVVAPIVAVVLGITISRQRARICSCRVGAGSITEEK